jgi:hypothetical protein
MPLTPREQLDIINGDFELENNAKFIDGQAEHGGNFFDKPTVQNIRHEVIDLVNYTHVLAGHRRVLLCELEEFHSMLVLANELPKDIPTPWKDILDKVVKVKKLVSDL